MRRPLGGVRRECPALTIRSWVPLVAVLAGGFPSGLAVFLRFVRSATLLLAALAVFVVVIALAGALATLPLPISVTVIVIGFLRHLAKFRT